MLFRRKDSSGTRSHLTTFLQVVVLIIPAVIVLILVVSPDLLWPTSKLSQRIPDETSLRAADSREGRVTVNGVTIFTKEELSKYSGEDATKPIYLAYLGVNDLSTFSVKFTGRSPRIIEGL